MALDKATLKSTIKQLLIDMSEEEGDQTLAFDAFAGGLSDAIDAYVKTATITATPTNITAATMVASGYPVTAGANLLSTIS